MELWDLYNEKREFLNKTFVRESSIPLQNYQGYYYHIVVGIWTVNSNKEVLLTLRDSSKKEYPDLWENTCGSVLAGEGSRAGAVRELFEETGIKATEEELFFIGTVKEETAFIDTYMIKKDIEIKELIMQKGETTDAKWVSLEELENMIKGNLIAAPVVKRLEKQLMEFEKFINGNNI